MNLNILSLYFIVIAILSMSFTDAAPCRGSIRRQNSNTGSHGKFQQKIQYPIMIDKTRTTLAQQIQEILVQAKDSPIFKKKKIYKSLLQQLKDIFHTKRVTVCERCKIKTDFKLYEG